MFSTCMVAGIYRIEAEWKRITKIWSIRLSFQISFKLLQLKQRKICNKSTLAALTSLAKTLILNEKNLALNG